MQEVIPESAKFYNLLYGIWANLFPSTIVEQYADTFAFITICLTLFAGVAIMRFIFSPFLPKKRGK